MWILKYREWLLSAENDARWVYDLCKEMPEWNENKQEYIFKKEPKRIDPREAKEIIKKNKLTKVFENEHGKVYA